MSESGRTSKPGAPATVPAAGERETAVVRPGASWFAPAEERVAAEQPKARFQRQQEDRAEVAAQLHRRAAPERATVQRKESGAAPSATNVQREAAAGVRSGGGALPHLDAIQRSFGAHDVRGVTAHAGPEARAAASAIGAQAYATGDRVAFGEPAPSLHTAAHEAAHVVQQRAGAVPSGVGQAGDRHERHADEVADLVVRGQSSQAALDRATGGARGRGAPSSAVQRIEGGTTDSGHEKEKEKPKSEKSGAPDPWANAKQTQESLGKLLAPDGAHDGEARGHLAQEIKRQVPDLALLNEVQHGGAKLVLSMIVSGGSLSIKALNDDLIGYQRNAELVLQRNQIIADAFRAIDAGKDKTLTIVEQTYKMTTLATNLGEPSALQAIVDSALTTIDARTKTQFKAALTDARAQWKKICPDGHEPAGPEQADAARRAANIDQRLKELDGEWRFGLWCGMAKVEGGGGGKEKNPPGYKEALEAKMNAGKAALVARTEAEHGGSKKRSAEFDQAKFIEFLDRADALRAEIISDGNSLEVKGVARKIFVDGKKLDAEVLRALRGDALKGAPKEKQAPQLRRLSEYLDRVTTLFYLKGFTGDEAVAEMPERLQQAMKLLDALQTDKDVDYAQVKAMIEQNLAGEVVPEMGTASEAAFYNKARDSQERILINADIRGLGLQAMQAYADSAHAITDGNKKGGMDRDALFKASSKANDPIIQLKRQAFAKLRDGYRECVADAIAKAKEHKPQSPEQLQVIAALEAEREPNMLLGGDEVTLSAHPALETFVPRLVQAIAESCNARATVTRASAAPAGKGQVQAELNAGAHKEAMREADLGAHVLKELEAEQRELEEKRERVLDREKRVEADRAIQEIGLERVYAEVKPGSDKVLLKQRPSGQVVEESALRSQIAQCKKKLGELIVEKEKAS